jgi:membrane-bound ClpP family serine protease
MRTNITGSLLALAGAIIDSYSSYSFFSGARITTSTMGMTTVHYDGSDTYWGISLAILAFILVTTAVASISFGAGRMPLFGALMLVYGLVMLIIGGLMLYGVSPMMQQQSSTLVSGVGMLVVGALMITNGTVMAWKPLKMQSGNDM